MFRPRQSVFRSGKLVFLPDKSVSASVKSVFLPGQSVSGAGTNCIFADKSVPGLDKSVSLGKKLVDGRKTNLFCRPEAGRSAGNDTKGSGPSLVQTQMVFGHDSPSFRDKMGGKTDSQSQRAGAGNDSWYRKHRPLRI